MSPDISVILPVYNSAPYLSESIASILNQSFPNFELLIINNNSSDRSENIIKSFSDPRIIYLSNESNKGLIYSLNRGIKESKGKYIARMDADDIALPDRFKLQYNFMEQHPEIGASSGYADCIGYRAGIWKYPVTNAEIKCRLMWGSSIIHPAAIIRKSILTEYNITYKEKYIDAEDHKLWVEISKVAELYNIPEVLLKYRIHYKQLTVTEKTSMDESRTKIVSEQLITVGVKIREDDFNILSKFLRYEYDFLIGELIRLIEIYTDFVTKNNTSHIYEPTIINREVENRLFEACYFSTKKCGVRAVKLYKQHFNINRLGMVKKLKFYYKGYLS